MKIFLKLLLLSFHVVGVFGTFGSIVQSSPVACSKGGPFVTTNNETTRDANTCYMTSEVGLVDPEFLPDNSEILLKASSVRDCKHLPFMLGPFEIAMIEGGAPSQTLLKFEENDGNERFLDANTQIILSLDITGSVSNEKSNYSWWTCMLTHSYSWWAILITILISNGISKIWNSQKNNQNNEYRWKWNYSTYKRRKGSIPSSLIISFFILSMSSLAKCTDVVANFGSSKITFLETNVGIALRDLVAQKAGKCHLFLVSASEPMQMFFPLFSWVEENGRTVMTVNTKFQRSSTLHSLLHGTKKLSSCWTVVLDLTSNGESILQFMEKSRLFYIPKMPVIMVGPDRDVERLLLVHKALRNSEISFLMTLSDRIIDTLNAQNTLDLEDTEELRIYARCLYCERGNAGIRLLHNWKFGSQLSAELIFEDETKKLNGYEANIVSKLRVPFVDFNRDWDGPKGTVEARDSLDVRIAKTAAIKFNFTFMLREPWDGQWGLPDESGNFTGIVGTLQYEKADFSFLLTPIPIRMSAVVFSRVYSQDPFVIISLKPGPLPKSLAIVTPFGDWVWIGLIVSCFTYCIMYWLLEKVRYLLTGGKDVELSFSFFYIWRILLEDPPVFIPRQTSSKILIGSWWLVCFIIMAGYRSALISHLTVIKRYRAINSMDDLLARSGTGYTWGRIYLSGASKLFLTENPSPVIRKVSEMMEVLPAETHLNRVLSGGYSFISRKYWALADLLKAEKEGLPVHMSITEYPVSSGYGWGYRKGAPIREPIDKLKQQLIEGGIVDFWLSQIVKNIADNMGPGETKTGGSLGSSVDIEQENNNRVLTLEHLQGSFYLTFIGYIVSVIVFMLEKIRFHWLQKMAQE